MRPQRWLPGCTGDAFAWRSHLRNAGLDTARGRAGTMPTRAAGGQIEELPIRKASIWLFSNIPAMARLPFRLALNQGLLWIVISRLIQICTRR